MSPEPPEAAVRRSVNVDLDQLLRVCGSGIQPVPVALSRQLTRTGEQVYSLGFDGVFGYEHDQKQGLVGLLITGEALAELVAQIETCLHRAGAQHHQAYTRHREMIAKRLRERNWPT